MSNQLHIVAQAVVGHEGLLSRHGEPVRRAAVQRRAGAGLRLRAGRIYITQQPQLDLQDFIRLAGPSESGAQE